MHALTLVFAILGQQNGGLPYHYQYLSPGSYRLVLPQVYVVPTEITMLGPGREVYTFTQKGEPTAPVPPKRDHHDQATPAPTPTPLPTPQAPPKCLPGACPVPATVYAAHSREVVRVNYRATKERRGLFRGGLFKGGICSRGGCW